MSPTKEDGGSQLQHILKKKTVNSLGVFILIVSLVLFNDTMEANEKTKNYPFPLL